MRRHHRKRHADPFSDTPNNNDNDDNPPFFDGKNQQDVTGMIIMKVHHFLQQF